MRCTGCGSLLLHGDHAEHMRVFIPVPESYQRECGTISGYQGHIEYGTTVCDECRTVKREYTRAWRARRKEQANG